MASQKDFKRRIASDKSTQKITKAMKLVSAAKFARASHAIHAARPYSEAFKKMVSVLLASGGQNLKSPLLRQSDEKKALMLLISSDRGLCGGLNANLFKVVKNWLIEKKKKGVEVDFLTWGRRPISFARKESLTVIGQLERVLEKPKYDFAKDHTANLVKLFTSKEYDHIYIAYPKFKSALVQEPQVNLLLPVEVEAVSAGENQEQSAPQDFILEPSLAQLIDSLLTRKVSASVFRALLEGAASDHGARMTAMDAATNNAQEVIKKLTLRYNRARQAAITTELTEIISGVEALN